MKKFLLSLFLVWHMQGFPSLDSLVKGLADIQQKAHVAHVDIKQMDRYPGGQGQGNLYVLIWAEEGQ